jgi:hypothetical protein
MDVEQVLDFVVRWHDDLTLEATVSYLLADGILPYEWFALYSEVDHEGMTTNDAINLKIVASVLGGFNGLTPRLMNEKMEYLHVPVA